MALSDNQLAVWRDRYALKGEDGTPIEVQIEDTWRRVADAIGNDVIEREDFYRILAGFHFVPGGRILAGAGTGHDVTAYNCYVIPLESNVAGRDSREAIFETMGRMVGIMSRGGGVGINWSVLRPKGSYLRRINGTSSGPIGWMDVASRAVGEVEQGGSRRGAAMFMLSDWHPDIEHFIDAKRNLNKITNANISVAISDAFMQAVKEDAEWNLVFPDTDHWAYNSEWDGDLKAWREEGRPVKVVRTVKARDLWYKIAQSAWDNGEPGIVFLERCQTESTASEIEKIVSVNPCGEQPLGEYSVCNLGSMNVAAYVTKGKFDFTTFGRDVRTAIRFLDNVIDKTYYIEELPQTYQQQMLIRRVGLGIMGLADALIKMGYRYGGARAIELTRRIFWTMKVQAIKESAILAAEKGPAEGWNNTMLDRPYLAKGDIPEDILTLVEQNGLRNLLLLTQAPTGTTAMLAGVNGGIEPYFAFQYWREDRLGGRTVEAPIVHAEVAPTTEQVWVDASLVSVEEHIATQAAAQEFVDASISKTINAPNSHTVEDVERAYMLAYESGLKGVAYFRDGCGRAQVLNREEPENDETQDEPKGLGKGVEGEHVHEKYRESGCWYCRTCSWSACEV